MVRRIFSVLTALALLALAACSAEPPDPPDEDGWQEIVDAYRQQWEASLAQDEETADIPFRLNVSVEVVARGGEPRSPIEAPDFSASGTDVVYWRNTEPAEGDVPDGAILVPGGQDFAEVIDELDGIQGDFNIAALLAMFYADHLIDELNRVGLLRPENVDETSRACLAGVTVSLHMGVDLLAQAEYDEGTVTEAMEFVANHRPSARDRVGELVPKFMESFSDEVCRIL